MGLKCRLLGHEYGDPEIERERQENGDEVVVTIRELQVCKRCESEHLVSENKEVTSIRSPSEVGLDDGGASDGPSPGAASAPDPSPARDATPVKAETDDSDPASHISEAEPEAPSAGSGPSPADADVDADAGVDAGVGDDEDDDFEPPQDPDEDDAVILDDDEAGERDSTQWPEETTADPAAAAEESAAAEDIPEDLPRDGDGEPVTDDAELIDADETHSVSSADQNASGDVDGDGETPADRGHGEWPARESTPADESGSNAPWPEQTGEDEGFDAEPSDGAPAEVAFSGGLTPEANGHAGSRDAIDGVVSSDEGFTRADEETELEADVPDERVEFYCPNCGHARTAGASSMRAGDICPECKKGYIAERQL